MIAKIKKTGDFIEVIKTKGNKYCTINSKNQVKEYEEKELIFICK